MHVRHRSTRATHALRRSALALAVGGALLLAAPVAMAQEPPCLDEYGEYPDPSRPTSAGQEHGFENTTCYPTANAYGYQNNASGLRSSAFGYANTASGHRSSAFGYANTASREQGSAFGYANTASTQASAFGYANTAGHTGSAFGAENTASGSQSSAFGVANTASWTASSAFGFANTAAGRYSSAFGHGNSSEGYYSSAFGNQNLTPGDFSSAFGFAGRAMGVRSLALASWWDRDGSGFYDTNEGTTASALLAVAIGGGAQAHDNFSLAIGTGSEAGNADASHTTGRNSVAVGTWYDWDGDGIFDAANGDRINSASGIFSSAFGVANTASGIQSSAFGYINRASGDGASAFGMSNRATGDLSAAFGYLNHAQGSWSSAFGYDNIASGQYSSAFGLHGRAGGTRSLVIASWWDRDGDGAIAFLGNEGTTASATNAVAIGGGAQAHSNSSVAIGTGSEAGDDDSHTDGRNSVAVGTWYDSNGNGVLDVADGDRINSASGMYGSAFGVGNTASGQYGSAFGVANTASYTQSSAFGYANNASGLFGSAFGHSNTASGDLGSAFGYRNSADGRTSSAFGLHNRAEGEASAAFGMSNTASGYSSTAFGYGSVTEVAATRGTAMGYQARVAAANSSAFGYQAVATESNVVSFGHAAGDLDGHGGTYTSALTARLIHVSDGIAATDAVNKGQLDVVGATADTALANAATAQATADDAMTAIGGINSYSGWTLSANGDGGEHIGSGESVDFAASDANGNLSVTRSGNTISYGFSSAPTFLGMTVGGSGGHFTIVNNTTVNMGDNVVSGVADDAEQTEAYAVGVDLYLDKFDVRRGALAEALDRLMDDRRPVPGG